MINVSDYSIKLILKNLEDCYDKRFSYSDKDTYFELFVLPKIKIFKSELIKRRKEKIEKLINE